MYSTSPRRHGEPLIDRKITYRVRSVFRDGTGRFAFAPHAIGLEMRYALESACPSMRPAAFFVDEAQHLTNQVLQASGPI